MDSRRVVESRCPSSFVEVNVRRAPAPFIIWSDGSIANDELLRDFAFRTCEPSGSPDECLTLADRYGATGWVGYGGSGRAVLKSGYQIKGAGRTPLLDPNADWHHSHGYMWFDEAFREVVFGQSYENLSETRASIIHAIIGFEDRHAHNRDPVLSVRSFDVRLAHFERALGRREGPDFHLADIKRIENYVSNFGEIRELLSQFARYLGYHAGFGNYSGFFNGGLFSSNVNVQGGLVDFGSARFAESWRRISFEPQGAPFGSEFQSACEIIRSLINGMPHKIAGDIDRLKYSELLVCGYEEGAVKAIQVRCCLDEERALFAKDMLPIMKRRFAMSQHASTEAKALEAEQDLSKDLKLAFGADAADAWIRSTRWRASGAGSREMVAHFGNVRRSRSLSIVCVQDMVANITSGIRGLGHGA